MEVVINPWWFYWLGVVDGVTPLCIVFAILCLFGCAASLDHRRKDLSIRFAIGAIVCCFIILFTPSSDTLIKMAVAQNVTVDRVAVAQDAAVKVYNDIIGLIKDNK